MYRVYKSITVVRIARFTSPVPANCRNVSLETHPQLFSWHLGFPAPAFPGAQRGPLPAAVAAKSWRYFVPTREKAAGVSQLRKEIFVIQTTVAFVKWKLNAKPEQNWGQYRTKSIFHSTDVARDSPFTGKTITWQEAKTNMKEFKKQSRGWVYSASNKIIMTGLQVGL